jgi:transcriptional regulator
MYLPPHFEEARLPVLHQLMRDVPLAAVVTLTSGGLTANHIPLELDPDAGPYGTLRGHVARGNPMWREVASGIDSLAIFQGPQSYISPSWYASKQEHGRVVPTWNYMVVHASGPLRIVDDTVWLRGLVERLTHRHEAHQTQPWRVSDAPVEFIEKQLAAIVGIEMAIRKIEGKWKVSQNRPATDREGVAAALRDSDSPELRALADQVAGGEDKTRSRTDQL